MHIQLVSDFSAPGQSAAGSTCYLCHVPKRDDAEGVVSTGVYIEGEGFLELCRECVMEAASLFGAASPERVAALGTKNRSLGMQVAALLKSRDAAEAQLQALRDEVEALRDLVKK